jgi:hypothetical protein
MNLLDKYDTAASSSSPDALGVVRNLPAAIAGATFHPPVAPARAVSNLQDGPEESRIVRVTVLAQDIRTSDLSYPGPAAPFGTRAEERHDRAPSCEEESLACASRF